MNTETVRRRMYDDGYSYEEIEAALDNLADAERNRRCDQQMEDDDQGKTT